MTNVSSRSDRIADLLLTRTYGRLMDDKGRRYHRASLILAFILGGIEGLALCAIIPAITAFTTDTPAMGMGWKGWVLVLVFLAVIGTIVAYLHSYLGYKAAIQFLGFTHEHLGSQLASLPLGWFKPGFPAEASHLLTDSIMSLGEGAAHYVGPIARGISTSIVLIVFSWMWAWQLGLALLIAEIIQLVVISAIRLLGERAEELKNPRNVELARRIVEYAATQPSLRASGRSHNYQPLSTAREENLTAGRKALILESIANFLSGMWIQGTIVVLLCLSAWLALDGALSPIATVAFIGIALRFSKVIEDASNMSLSIETARVPAKEIGAILDSPTLPEPVSPAVFTAPGAVEFDHVTFGYHVDTPVIRDVSFSVPPRSFTALVGPSGCGKTTLFRLIARFWDVGGGTVRIGGVDVRDQPTEQLMSQLAMVFQDVYLYDTTLWENIAVGHQSASREDILRAAQLAGVDEIAERLPGGWDSLVGEGGNRLSGGEKQRVSVARALLKAAPIVLLDEATSALDPHNEAAICRSIGELRQHATVMVIAHTLETIRTSDQIVVINESGSVEQVGTHAELLAAGGLYTRLWEARSRAQGWRLIDRP